ncbi:LysE family translocator [Fodinicola acaciae]|uniref:LysE family translocator n=1 Tax=Fodinicola acaciae TaxID=2681555 RepID=UPI0013D4154D|nr:LysE family translocator [Fodinicola acaciae]
MDLQLLLPFVVAITLISLVPGPDMFYIVANGIAGGPRAGVVAAVGMSTGMAVHTLAAAAGLSALFIALPAAMDVLRVVGIAVLLYLAMSTLRSSFAQQELELRPEQRPLSRTYGMAVLTNVSNPKVIVFYLAFMPQFTDPHGAWPVPVQLLALGLLFITVGLGIDAGVGLAAGKLSGLLAGSLRFRRWLQRVSAAVFGALAVDLGLSRG